MAGVHEVPDKLKDEDKWFKLTVRQLAIIAPTLVILLLINIAVFNSALRSVFPLFVIISGIILTLAVVVAFFEMPDDKYMFGSGLKFEVIAIRLIKKRFKKNKKIYTKHYNNGIKEWMEK